MDDDAPAGVRDEEDVRDERLGDGVEDDLEHAEPEELRRGHLAQQPAEGDEHGRHTKVALEERGHVQGRAHELALDEPVPEVVVDDAPLQACVYVLGRRVRVVAVHGKQPSRVLLTKARHHEGVASGRVTVAMEKSHQVAKAEEHHDVDADPHAVKAGGRPPVRAGVRGLAAGIWDMYV